MKKKLWLGIVSSISSVALVASCSCVDPDKSKTSETKKTLESPTTPETPTTSETKTTLESPITTKITNLITELKSNPSITSPYAGSEFPKDPNVIAAVTIFRKYNVVIELNRGTSSRQSYIGNKYGNVTYFINHILAKTVKQLAITTIDQMARLFVLDPANDKYKNVATITKNLYLAWETSSQLASDDETAKEVAISPSPTAIASRTSIIDSYYNNVSNLKESDSFWTLSNLRYSNGVTKGLGQTYYKNIARNAQGKWDVQFNLEDWINVYDTPFNEITSDPHHIYKLDQTDDPGAPRGYSSQLPSFYKIYSDKNAGKTRTGNNNNGLNGLYSGANFEAKNNQKLFDLASLMSFNGGKVVLGLTRSGKTMFGNGWEHVSPASKAGMAFGESRKSPRTEGFKYALGDLHNLRPSMHNLFNARRSNYQYGIVPGANNKYFGVDFEIGPSSFGLKVVEPRISVRGDVARVLFYMHDRYHIKYDLDYYKLLLLWARMDPVTPQELAFDQKIKSVMGFSNDYVTGAKKLPYDQAVEAKIINANNDQTANTNTPGVATQVLWSKSPDSVTGAISVINPVDKEVVLPTRQPSQ